MSAIEIIVLVRLFGYFRKRIGQTIHLAFSILLITVIGGK